VTERTQAVAAFAFGWTGEEGDRSPGASNEAIAAAVARLPADTPVVAEAEVADALTDDVRLLQVVDLTHESRHPGTEAVAQQFARALGDAGLRRVVVLAHPGHRRRAARSCRRAGLDVVDTPRVQVGFDKKSRQWWTRGPVRWWVREAPLRLVETPLAFVQQARARLTSSALR
jgi:uncharacterized SAM-binding protein YcdF (DUF218 family)